MARTPEWEKLEMAVGHPSPLVAMKSGPTGGELVDPPGSPRRGAWIRDEAPAA